VQTSKQMITNHNATVCLIIHSYNTTCATQLEAGTSSRDQLEAQIGWHLVQDLILIRDITITSGSGTYKL
jgi:hypothetical protein